MDSIFEIVDDLLHPLWHLGGPSNDPGDLGSNRREILESRLGFLSVWGGIQDLGLRVFGGFGSNICVFLHVCFQVRFLNDFGV